MIESREAENFPATRWKLVNRFERQLEAELVVNAVGYIAFLF